MNFDSDTNVVEVAVRRLRAKLDDPFPHQAAAHRARHGLCAGGPRATPAGGPDRAIRPPAGPAQPARQSLTDRPACARALCSHSIATRLSKKLALFTAIVIGLVSAASWLSMAMLVKERNAQEQVRGCELVADILALEARNGGELAVLQRLRSDAPMRANARLEVWRADGSAAVCRPGLGGPAAVAPQRAPHAFAVDTPGMAGGQLQAHYTMDFTRSAALGTRWALILVAASRWPPVWWWR